VGVGNGELGDHEGTNAGKIGASFAVPAREKKAVARSLDEGPFLVWAYGPRRL